MPFDTKSEDVTSLSSFDLSDSLNKVYNDEDNFKIEVKIKYSKSMKSQKIQYFLQTSYYNTDHEQNRYPKIEFIETLTPSETFEVGEIQKAYYKIAALANSKGMGMVTAVINWPSCYDIEFDQLELLQRQLIFDFFEVDKVKHSATLYWTRI